LKLGSACAAALFVEVPTSCRIATNPRLKA
jgi:hypothetical protein